MQAITTFLSSYGTRAIAVALGTLTTLVGTGIIPDSQAKYYMAAIAVLTYLRGQSTSNAYDRGVVQGNASATVPAPVPPASIPLLKPSSSTPAPPEPK
jgi:hypothetical protein